jgi:broad specificity phosphatase PhoE
MELYLVRHGESEGNAQSLHQPAGVGLSARGREEARLLAQRFSSLPIDAIVSSPFARALQTATTIALALDQPVVQSALFDEETFFDLRARAIAALKLVSDQRAEHLLIVTHGQFMRMLVCVMTFGPELQPAEFDPLQSFLSMANGAITRCAYQARHWRLLTWNDRAHLR